MRRVLVMFLVVLGLASGAVPVAAARAAAGPAAPRIGGGDEPLFAVGLSNNSPYVVGEVGYLILYISSQPLGTELTVLWDTDGDGAFDDVVGPDGAFTPTTAGHFIVYVKVRHSGMPEGEFITNSTVANVYDRATLSPVSITGIPRVGTLLLAAGGDSTPDQADRTWEWMRDGAIIPGTVAGTYQVVRADAGRRITVRVLATKYGYADAHPVISKPVAVAALNVVRPTFLGTTRVHQRLHGRLGTWIAPGHVRTYRWLRDGKAIRGATDSTYVTTRADQGHRISFRVYVQRSGFPTVAATSTARTITR